MQIDRLSNSSINKYKECEMAFFIEYILKMRFPIGKAGNKGTIVHKVIEILGKIKQAQDSNKDFYNKSFDLSYDKEAPINIEVIFSKIYSHYTSGQFARDKFTKKDREECLKWTNVALDHNKGNFSPLVRSIVDLERYFRFPIRESWSKIGDGDSDDDYLKISGIIDCVYEFEGEDAYEIVDWKTGQRRDWITGEKKTNHNLREDLQLLLYHYAAHELYGYDKDYLITIFYLKDGGPFTIYFDKEDIDYTKVLLEQAFTSIKNNISPNQHRSWKCHKMCPFGKNTFANTKHSCFTQYSPRGISRVGSTSTICDQISYEIDVNSINEVIKTYAN